MTNRVGQGFDVHPFGGDGPLVLGGVTLDGPGLRGHSDADPVCHAVCDALLGAAGLGDIGEHFPDTDPRWRGAASTHLLAHVVDLVSASGFVVENVDVTVILEAPKLAPHRPQIEATLNGVLRAPISVKAKRAEGLGALGRSEGVACFAVALLSKP